MKNLVLFWGEKSDESFTWVIEEADNSLASATNIAESNRDSRLQSDLVRSQYAIEKNELLKDDLSCLSDMLGEGSVTLLISAKDVVVTQVPVPNKAQKLLRKAIPFILEDEVASPIDKLFFAFSTKNKSNLLPVRAIDKNYLEEIVRLFNNAEIKLAKILVDIDIVRSPEEGLSVVLNNSECLVVDKDENRWHCHQKDFSWLTQKSIEQQSTDTKKNEKNNSDEARIDEDSMSVAMPLELISSQEMDQFERGLPVGRFITEHNIVENIQTYLTQQLTNINGTEVNLLQAEFEPKKENSQIFGFLAKVALVSGLVLITHLVAQTVSLYTLTEKKAQLEQQKLTLYKQAFPSRKLPNSGARATKNMRAYIKSIGGGGNDIGFLSLLNSSSEKLLDLNKIYPTNISYDNAKSELRIDLIASDLIVLDKYAEDLRASGHKVAKSSETQTGDGYSSRLTINRMQ